MEKIIINNVPELREAVISSLIEKSMTIYELEDLSGVSKTCISDVKNRKVPGTLETLMRLASALDVRYRFDCLRKESQ